MKRIPIKKYTDVKEYIRDIYPRLYVREKAAADILLKKSFITSADLDMNGIDHRAIRDLQDRGIPLVKEDKRIRVPEKKDPVVCFKLGNPFDIHIQSKYGRRDLTKVKKILIKRYGRRCVFCGKEFSTNKLQVDHKLPVSYFGDVPKEELTNPEHFQLVCASCNRKKDEFMQHNNCEQKCFNKRDDPTCMNRITTCYWCDPVNYTHKCSTPRSYATIDIYDKLLAKALEKQADSKGQSVQEFATEILKNTLKK